jgi:hypothetical protein
LRVGFLQLGLLVYFDLCFHFLRLRSFFFHWLRHRELLKWPRARPIARRPHAALTYYPLLPARMLSARFADKSYTKNPVQY